MGVEKWLVMYKSSQTVVRDSKAFGEKVVLKQGSLLSLLLFVILTKVISKELQVGLSWELYADDLV